MCQVLYKVLHKPTWLQLILEFDLCLYRDPENHVNHINRCWGVGSKHTQGWVNGFISMLLKFRFQIHSLTSKVHRLCKRERNKPKFFKSQVIKYSTSCQQRMGSSLIKTIAYNTHSISTANTNYWNIFLINKMIILANHFNIFHINNHL